MNLRQLIENLKNAGVSAERAFQAALALYERKEIEPVMKELFPDYKLPAEETAPARAAAPAPAQPAQPAAGTDVPAADSRAVAIADLCLLAGIPEKGTEYIRSQKTLEEVRADILAAKTAGAQPANDAGGQHVRVVADEREKYRNAQAGAIMLRAGVKDEKVKDAENIRSSGLVGYSLMDIARRCLELEGQNIRLMSKDRLIARAFAGGDFPYIIGTGANRVLGTAYAEFPGTFQIWTGRGILTDFKATDIVKRSGFGTLDTVMAGENYRKLPLAEYKESTRLVTLGNIVVLTRQMMYNDDLGAFTSVLQSLGAAAKRTLNHQCYDLLIQNANLNDGVALFHATHKNLGTGGAISNTTIGELVQLLRRAVDPNGVPLNLPGAYFLCCTLKEALAEQYLGTYNVVYPAAASVDPYRGKFKIVVDPEMDGSTGATATRYALTTDPRLCDTITTYYLDGRDTPELFQEESRGAEADGILYKVRFDAVPAVGDFRGMAYNAGA